MQGRVCLITGASNGIGKAAAIRLARMGASLVLLCRDRDRGETAMAEISLRSGNEDIDLVVADLASLRQVRESRPARIVNLSSEAHRIGYGDGRIAFDDLMGERHYGGWKAYGQSKLANILFTRELSRRLNPAEVTANAVHPGVVASQFGRNNRKGWMPWLQALYRPFARGNEKGADTAVWLAAAPENEGVTGEYFKDRKLRTPAPQALDDEDAARLWQVSAALVSR